MEALSKLGLKPMAFEIFAIAVCIYSYYVLWWYNLMIYYITKKGDPIIVKDIMKVEIYNDKDQKKIFK